MLTWACAEVPKAPSGCVRARFDRYKTRLLECLRLALVARSRARVGYSLHSYSSSSLVSRGPEFAALDSSKAVSLAGEPIVKRRRRGATRSFWSHRWHWGVAATTAAQRCKTAPHRQAVTVRPCRSGRAVHKKGKGPRPRPRQVSSSAIRKRDRRGGRPRARRLGGGPARARGAAADDKTVDGRRPRARG